MAAFKKYIKEMTKEFGYHATWTPAIPIKLGDIGVFHDGVFERVNSLKNLGFVIEERPTLPPEKFLEYKSEHSVNIKFKTAAEAAPVNSMLGAADAGVIIEFGKEGGVYFKANDVKTRSIENIGALHEFIRKTYDNGNGEWKRKWVVITELKEAASATILYSQSGNGKVEIKAKGDISLDKIDLANAESGLSIMPSSETDIAILAENNLTPLFKAIGVRKRFWLWGETEVVPKFIGENATTEELVVNELPIGEISPKMLAKRTLYALVVGINNFKHIQHLKGCVNDAKDFMKYLTEIRNEFLAIKTVPLFDRNATKANIVKGISMLGQVEEGDIVVFYFSGHGAQELGGELFGETDDKLEVLACHDSSNEISGSFLSDKELRYLFKQLSDTGAEVVTLFDCCHSGENMRGELRARRLSKFVPKRAWKDFIFAEEISEEAVKTANTLEEVLPMGNYITLAACQAHESAWESYGRGLFTSNLTKLLRKNGAISYNELNSRITTLIPSKFNQHPKMEFNGNDPDLPLKAFLGGTKVSKAEELYVNQKDGAWVLDVGQLNGVRKTSKAVVDILNPNGSGEILTTASIRQVQISSSTINPTDPSCLVDGESYTARIEGLNRQDLSLYISGDEAAVEVVKTYCSSDNQQLNGWRVDWVDEPTLASYFIEAKDNQFVIKDTIYNQPLVEEIQYTPGPAESPTRTFIPVEDIDEVNDNVPDELSLNDPNVKSALETLGEYLDHISFWEAVKTLEHPKIQKSQIIDEQWLDKTFTLKLEQVQAGELVELTAVKNNMDKVTEFVLPYVKNDDGITPPKTRLSVILIHEGPRPMHYAMLLLNTDFAIFHSLIEGKMLRLDPKKGVRSGTVPFTQSEHTTHYQLGEETIYLKIIGSTKPFDISKFDQKGLPAPLVEDTKSPDRSKGAVMKRGADVDDIKTSSYWFTKLVKVSLPNPLLEKHNEEEEE